MKKLLSLLVACCLLLSVGAALAEGGLTTTNAMFVLAPFYGDYVGYAYAEVVNNSNEMLTVDYETSALKLMNAAGEVLYAEDIFFLSPQAIGPGETGFVMAESIYLEADVAEQLTTYSLSVNGVDSWYMDPLTYLPEDVLTADLIVGTDAYGDSVTWIYTLVENPNKGLLFDYGCVLGLYDQKGRLIYATEIQTYGVGIPVGQSAMLRMESPDELTAYWADKNITPTSIKVFGYLN